MGTPTPAPIAVPLFDMLFADSVGVDVGVILEVVLAAAALVRLVDLVVLEEDIEEEV